MKTEKNPPSFTGKKRKKGFWKEFSGKREIFNFQGKVRSAVKFLWLLHARFFLRRQNAESL